jgi:hypothetical protein
VCLLLCDCGATGAACVSQFAGAHAALDPTEHPNKSFQNTFCSLPMLV